MAQDRVATLIRMPREMHRIIAMRRLVSRRSFNAEVCHMLEQLLGGQEVSDYEAFKLLRSAPTSGAR